MSALSPSTSHGPRKSGPAAGAAVVVAATAVAAAVVVVDADLAVISAAAAAVVAAAAAVVVAVTNYTVFGRVREPVRWLPHFLFGKGYPLARTPAPSLLCPARSILDQ